MEDLVADTEQPPEPPPRDMSIRRRLEDLLEQRRSAADLEDFEDYDI